MERDSLRGSPDAATGTQQGRCEDARSPCRARRFPNRHPMNTTAPISSDLDVINMEGVGLGRVASVFSNGAHDLLRVTSGERERLLPFVAEVIRTVDLAQRRIEVDWGADW